jgi:hypothetical protein
MSTPIRQWLRPLCACALALTSLLAHAQYSWIDDHGARVFSDRPPPPGTPPSRILKTPRGLEPAAEPTTATAAAAASAASAAPAPDWQVREAEFRERTAKRGKEEREAEVKRKQDRDAECSWARGAQRELTVARRLEWKNRKGEPELMSDADRARELDKVQRILPGCG